MDPVSPTPQHPPAKLSFTDWLCSILAVLFIIAMVTLLVIEPDSEKSPSAPTHRVDDRPR